MDNAFAFYRDKNGEVGFVEQILQSVVYVTGLPSAKIFEKVIFEGGDIGHVLSLTSDHAEVLMLTQANLSIGQHVARTGGALSIPVSEGLLGSVINPLGSVLNEKAVEFSEQRLVDTTPKGISYRKKITESFETGIPMVDLVIPLARGQRELVIGDRKTGKTSFLLQAVVHAVSQGYICVYSCIGKRNSDIVQAVNFFKENKILDHIVIVATSSTDPTGLIYTAPYTAMSVAEYFCDKGKNVVIVLDDLTTHAQVYREIMLLAKKFPGRGSYPGDIFYTHARLLERAGSYRNGTITALPVAESVMGDLSGYIQTNLMAITDGHIFFDIDMFNEGRRPAINPYLSVTRVGEQTQKGIVRDASRELNRFLVHYQRVKHLRHFGAEMSASVNQILSRADKINHFFDQGSSLVFPVNLSLYLLALIWMDYYSQFSLAQMKKSISDIRQRYYSDQVFKSNVDGLMSISPKFEDLVKNLPAKNLMPS